MSYIFINNFVVLSMLIEFIREFIIKRPHKTLNSDSFTYSFIIFIIVVFVMSRLSKDLTNQNCERK
jgi:hypothetical protein